MYKIESPDYVKHIESDGVDCKFTITFYICSFIQYHNSPTTAAYTSMVTIQTVDPKQ